MEWIEMSERLPKEGDEVLFVGEEIAPIYGRIKYNGKWPSILVMDSSAEENEYVDIKQYTRWLDESNAIEGEAVAFARWLDDRKVNADKHFNRPRSATTEELYELFKKQK